MKTLKKVFPFFLLLSLCGAVLFSCKDDADDGPKPKVSYIITADAAAKDSLLVGANAGNYIIIVGENLTSVVQIYFDDVKATLNPVYVTDNYIILQVPEVSGSTQWVILKTKKGVETRYAFAVNIPAPVVTMFYCEFVPAGETLRMKGNYFIKPKVFFYGEDGVELIEGVIDEGKSSTREIYVTVPEKAGYSMPIVVENGSGRAESRIFFRDQRNMIIDFDDYRGFGGFLRDWEEDGFPFPMFIDNSYSPSAYCPDEYLIGEEANPDAFPKGCDRNYNLLNAWKDGDWQKPGRIQFHIKEDPDDLMPNPRRDDPVLSKSLMGPFLSEYDSRSMVLKFEVYVPKKYPINGAWLYVYFPAAGGGAWDSNSGWGMLSPELTPVDIQVPLAFWCPFEADIDKTNGGKDDGTWKWNSGADCKTPFHTNDTWMTVAVPLSKVLFHGWISNPGDYLWKGDTGIPRDYSDAGNPALSANTILSKDPAKALGDMIVQFPVWSGIGNQSGKFMLFVDNFRLVPEDGGGAVYGRGTGADRSY